MNIIEIDDYLKDFLSYSQFYDTGVNGMQVENHQELHTLTFAVDSTLSTLQKSVDAKSQFLFVHHGLFWGTQEILTNTMYQKTKLMIENSLGLYAIHLPLDAHPTIGNNIQIAKALEVENPQQNLFYKETALGYIGTIAQKKLIEKCKVLFPETFVKHYQEKIENIKKPTLRIGISSGSFSSSLFTQNQNKVDLFLTGEVNLPTYNIALDHNIPIIPLGHYYTEVFGIKALMKILQEKYSLLNFKFIGDDKLI